jgi:predicted Kef-type K+ transport protein
VTLGSFLSGQSVQTSVKTGMSLAQIGEFSFIIVGITVSTGPGDRVDVLVSELDGRDAVELVRG